MSASVDFIIGRAGSGKTFSLYERIAVASAAGERCILIVPDQATFEAERSLSTRLGGGLFGCEVFSWSSLARAALAETGDRRTYLTPQGRIMLMRRTVDACAARLSAFASVAAHAGFPVECDSVIVRFKRCGVTPQQLASAAEGLDNSDALKAKLIDFSILYNDISERMCDRYIDAEDMMNALCARLPSSQFAGAKAFIDCENSMNEQNYRVIASLLSICPTVCIALTIDDSEHCRDRAVFEPNRRVMRRVTDDARALGCSVATVSLAPRCDFRAPALSHIERELFARDRRPFEKVSTDASSASKSEADDGVSIFCAADRRTEAIATAEAIRAAASTGTRYRDMAVVVSDLQGYSAVISRVFRAYGVPYYTDVKRTVAMHPLSELIISALCAAERGFDSDNVIAVLKTGYTGISAFEAERLENYMLEWGIYGKRLLTPFEKGDTDDALESSRRQLMEPLVELRDSVREATARVRAEAIYHYLDRLNIDELQQTICQRLHSENKFALEAENAQVAAVIMQLLDQLYVILGDGRMGLKRFIAIVREGLAAYEVATIPSTCDQVLVGDIGRTRSRQVKKLFVLGINEGLLPKSHHDDSVIDDKDLSTIKDMGLPVWDSGVMQGESDLLDVYSAFAKPTESIAFSYPVAAEGSALAPGLLFDRICGLFPSVPVKNLVTEPVLCGEPDMALVTLAARMRTMLDTGDRDETTALLYAWFHANSRYHEPLDMLFQAFFADNSPKPLGAKLAKRLYGSTLFGSASRLETFNSCPFRHYIEYGFKAKERKEFCEKTVDVGTFYHAALDAYTRCVIERGLDWAQLSDVDVLDILRELLPPLMVSHNRGVMLDTARARARFAVMLDAVRSTAVAMTHQIGRGEFRPVGSEIRFGTRDAMLPALRISLPSGVSFYVQGIIDRVDAFDNGSASGVRIVDYKSGDKRFSYSDLAAGLQIQLPLYAAALAAADAAEMNLPQEIVGLYYMRVKNPARSGEPDPTEYITPALMREFKLRGISLSSDAVITASDPLMENSSDVIPARRDKNGMPCGAWMVSRDEFDKVIDCACSQAASALTYIYEGRADIRPCRHAGSSPVCRYCPVADVCRFEPGAFRSDAYRTIGEVSEAQFLGRDS